MAVSASSPYLAYFVHKGEPGARHDFLIHQQYTQVYNNYLKVTQSDISKDSGLKGREYWDMLADKGNTLPSLF